jgi:hypothetical protein
MQIPPSNKDTDLLRSAGSTDRLLGTLSSLNQLVPGLSNSAQICPKLRKICQTLHYKIDLYNTKMTGTHLRRSASSTGRLCAAIDAQHTLKCLILGTSFYFYADSSI